MMSKIKNKKQNIWKSIVTIVIVICIIALGYISQNTELQNKTSNVESIIQTENIIFDLSTIPEYTSSPYVEINNNIPYFMEEDYTTKAFENYSDWDEFGEVGLHMLIYVKK